MTTTVTNNEHLTHCCNALDESGFSVTVVTISEPAGGAKEIHMAHGTLGNHVLKKLKGDIAAGDLYPADHYIGIATQLREAERRLRHRTIVEAAVQQIGLTRDTEIFKAAETAAGSGNINYTYELVRFGINAAVSEAIATQIADKE